MKQQTIELILQEKIITIVRGVAIESLIPFAQALYDGGIRLLEITYSADQSRSDKETANAIRMLVEHFQGRMAIGAGTVLTKEQVQLTAKAGGQFIISPDTNESVIRETNLCGLVSIPGALTPTEVMTAHNAGADFVKLFPADVFGPRYIKTLKAPLSQVRLLAVNGINLENMTDYAQAGACGFGIGSALVRKDLIAEGLFEKITEIAREYSACAKGGYYV